MRFKSILLISMTLAGVWVNAGPTLTANPKSKEYPEDLPVGELLNSQYFRLSPNRQMEVKDLRGFVEFANENKTIKCSFFKKKIPTSVKVEIAAGSVWENNTGVIETPVNLYQNKDTNEPVRLAVILSKGADSLEYRCEFTSKVTGQFDSKSEEEAQRAKCEARGGIYTRYSRREFDYACDYKLSYGDLKKVMISAGFDFEIRKEPPIISVVVLGQDPKPTKKRSPRQPSSIKKRP